MSQNLSSAAVVIGALKVNIIKLTCLPRIQRTVHGYTVLLCVMVWLVHYLTHLFLRCVPPRDGQF